MAQSASAFDIFGLGGTSGSASGDFETPAYLFAMDTHTSLNGGSKEKGFLESSLDLVTKGIPASLIAAGNELSNIPASVGNIFMGKGTFEITESRSRIADIDSDLAKYYDDHKLGIDTMGFIVSSFVPGMAATKVLRAGQVAIHGAVATGKFGKLTGNALGLLAPTRDMHLAAATKAIADTGNVFKLAESNLLKAFASGIGQNALEGAVWTAAVDATLSTSPILDHRDTKDLVVDVLTGAALGGLVGGLFSGIGAAYKVKRAATAAEKEILPWTVVGLGGEVAPGLSTSDKILTKLKQLEAIPVVDPNNPLATRIGAAAAKTQRDLQLQIRALSGELAGGDQAIAGQMNRIMGEITGDKAIANFLDAVKITRLDTPAAIENFAIKAFNKLAKAVNVLDDTASKEALEAQRYKVSYWNLRTSAVSANKPQIGNLADIGDVIVTPRGVRVGKSGLYPQDGTHVDVSKLTHDAAEARYAWAEEAKKFVSGPEAPVLVLGPNDIPMLQKAMRDGVTRISAGTTPLESLESIALYTKTKQAEIAAELLKTDITKAEISKIVNASEDVLFGAVDNHKLWNARDFVRQTYQSLMGDDPHKVPTYAKVLTDTKSIKDIDGNLLEGMAVLAQREKIYKEKAARTAAGLLNEDLPDAAGISGQAIGATSGPTFLASEGGNFGSQSSFYSYVGQRTHNVRQQAVERVKEVFTPTLQKLGTTQSEVVHFAVLDEQLRNLPQGYRLSRDGAQLVFGKAPAVEGSVAFVASKAKDAGKELTESQLQKAVDAHFTKQLDEFTKLRLEHEAAGFPATIDLKYDSVKQLVLDHIRENGRRGFGIQQIHANNGYQHRFDPDVYYPIPRNPKDTPHFAFVVDSTVSGRGHSKMIYAKDGETLELMRQKILTDPDLVDRGITVLTKGESEEYFKSIGQYEFEHTLSENYINNALIRSGKSASFLPLTDPQRIINNFLDWHVSRENALVRTAVEHKYQKEFDTLRQYASGSVEAAKSKFGYVSPLAYAENTVNNPASNLIKMALDISKIDEYPLWTPLNKFLDGAFSSLKDKFTKTFSNATSLAHLDSINADLKKAGYKDVIVDSALYEAMNGTIPRGQLTSVVNKANTILAAFALNSDPWHAINNSVGGSVLLGTELKSLLRQIASRDELAGELANIAYIKTPGTGDSVLSATKLIANRIGLFHSDTAGRAWFKQRGFISDITSQYFSTVDQLAVAVSTGSNSALQKAMDGVQKFSDFSRKVTGNNLAEEFQRYLAAGVMKDVTDIAVKGGIMTPDTALAYINTFVNRVQGNYLASQRPAIFQGPLGQAIGLFQTYQFNLLQQVFRHVGEGSKKDLLMLTALQGGIYGMNGLPAFNAINTHIIGQAGGNLEHKTLYDAVLSGAGKEAGEWLLYGGLSNGLSLFHPDLKTNVYTRGDINPRHVTLLPVDPTKIPIYQATERLLSNIKQGVTQTAMGANVWDTFLRGVEHNGVSRPLAGMAQVLEALGRDDSKVISTSQQGNMLMAHDLYSLTSLMRITGAKPLDEAIVNDAMFRINTYRAADSAKRKNLAEGIRNTILGGGVPDEGQINSFALAYAKTGGKQDEFANFMAHQYTATSISKAEQLRRNLSNPYSQSMQLLMGGEF